MRRRWYRDNIDQEFDINFEPSVSNENAQNAAAGGGAAGGAYQNYMN
jgi:hypothetical protein